VLNLPNAFLSIANMFSAALGGPLWAGFVLTETNPVYDDGGSIITPGGTDRAACKVQIDALDQRARPDGWTEKDYRFIILAASVQAGDLIGDVPPIDTDARVQVADSTAPADFRGIWLVSALQRDPAGIGFVGKGRRQG